MPSRYLPSCFAYVPFLSNCGEETSEIICMVFQSQKEDMPKTTPCVRVIEIPDRKWQSRGE